LEQRFTSLQAPIQAFLDLRTANDVVAFVEEMLKRHSEREAAREAPVIYSSRYRTIESVE
jgi:hypothetical protein